MKKIQFWFVGGPLTFRRVVSVAYWGGLLAYGGTLLLLQEFPWWPAWLENIHSPRWLRIVLGVVLTIVGSVLYHQSSSLAASLDAAGSRLRDDSTEKN